MAGVSREWHLMAAHTTHLGLERRDGRGNGLVVRVHTHRLQELHHSHLRVSPIRILASASPRRSIPTTLRTWLPSKPYSTTTAAWIDTAAGATTVMIFPRSPPASALFARPQPRRGFGLATHGADTQMARMYKPCSLHLGGVCRLVESGHDLGTGEQSVVERERLGHCLNRCSVRIANVYVEQTQKANSGGINQP